MPGNTPNTGNFFGSSYAVTGSSNYTSSQNYLTDVGAYTASASPYGAFDMGGDVNQWNEALIDPSDRGLRGGSWFDMLIFLQSEFRLNRLSPTTEYLNFGFRVALVPEPSTAVLASIAGLMWTLRKRRK